MSDAVRAFAQANRLRFVRTEDGAYVLPIGPRKRSAFTLDVLGAHAWEQAPGLWEIVVSSGTPDALLARLTAAGAAQTHRWDDGMIAVRCPADDLLRILDAGGDLTRPWRKRTLSPERRAAAVQRFAALRNPM